MFDSFFTVIYWGGVIYLVISEIRDRRKLKLVHLIVIASWPLFAGLFGLSTLLEWVLFFLNKFLNWVERAYE